MLNSIGLQNVGIDKLRRDLAPTWARWKVPVIVSILGSSAEEYGECAAALEGVEGVAALELNISSPNAQRGGMEFGQDRGRRGVGHGGLRARDDAARHRQAHAERRRHRRDRAPRRRCRRQRALRHQHAAGDVDRREAPQADASRACSPGCPGPAMKPVALRMVWQVAGAVDVPIIGCGGISTGTDALEFIMAGATAVQVGTATFRDPNAPLDVLDGIERFMRDEGVHDITELIGAARSYKAADYL